MPQNLLSTEYKWKAVRSNKTSYSFVNMSHIDCAVVVAASRIEVANSDVNSRLELMTL